MPREVKGTIGIRISADAYHVVAGEASKRGCTMTRALDTLIGIQDNPKSDTKPDTDGKISPLREDNVGYPDKKRIRSLDKENADKKKIQSLEKENADLRARLKKMEEEISKL